MDILLVEDEEPKREHLLGFLSRTAPRSKVRVAKSVRSAMDQLHENTPDLVLLDMSLPTFDVTSSEPGGRPQGFGGIEIIRYMELEEIYAPIVVVTAYEAFSQDGREIDLESLDKELYSAHSRIYFGLVYFNSVFDDWAANLEHLLAERVTFWSTNK